VELHFSLLSAPLNHAHPHPLRCTVPYTQFRHVKGEAHQMTPPTRKSKLARNSSKPSRVRRKSVNTLPPATSPDKQIAGFLAKFEPALSKKIQSCRTILRKRFPTAVEIVYDNYNFLVFGFAATDRPSSTVVAIAANSKGVGLSFYWGATLPDPHKILEGSGSQNRFIRLPTPAVLSDPQVVALINDAEAQAKIPLSKSAKGYTLIKSISAKQRPRR
jgi:hypothetical protein